MGKVCKVTISGGNIDEDSRLAWCEYKPQSHPEDISGDVTTWQNTCLAWVKPWACPPALQKKKKISGKDEGRKSPVSKFRQTLWSWGLQSSPPKMRVWILSVKLRAEGAISIHTQPFAHDHNSSTPSSSGSFMLDGQGNMQTLALQGKSDKRVAEYLLESCLQDPVCISSVSTTVFRVFIQLGLAGRIWCAIELAGCCLFLLLLGSSSSSGGLLQSQS